MKRSKQNVPFPQPRPPDSPDSAEQAVRGRALVCLLLIAVTTVVYWRVVGYGFVIYDDPVYFAGNPQVLAGLTREGVMWAFSAYDNSSWYPLTWLSFMCDVEWFGKGPRGPHLTNLFLHAINTVLLFLLLKRLTRAHWRSALVAALFALHPLHVESVAWISERKGLLSAFFNLLSLLCYVRYAGRRGTGSKGQGARADGAFACFHVPSSASYWLSLFFFTCGLMSKPMLVTLPFVLLLLDCWPLQRFTLCGFVLQRFALQRLLLEKVPFLVVSAVSSVITFVVHQRTGMMVAIERLSMADRIGNAFVSYARYLGKTFWPVNLATPYPHPGHWPFVYVLLAALLMVWVCAVALRLGRTRPFVFVGWCWFWGTLVPVIGLVQWGHQSMADRFTYVPLIGVFIMLAWGAGELLTRWQPSLGKEVVTAVGAGLILAACGARTADQLRYWRDSESLCRRAIAMTKNNQIAYNNLGSVLVGRQQYAEAISCYETALRIAPDYEVARYNLGVALEAVGRGEEAIGHYTEAVRLSPHYAEAHDNLGNALARSGRLDEAIGHLLAAVRFRPNDPQKRSNLGNALTARGQLEEAIEQYREALRLAPGHAAAHNNLGYALAAQGRLEEAENHYREALRLNGRMAEAHCNLGCLLVRRGRQEEAVQHLTEALRLKPDYPLASRALFDLGEKVRK